MKKKVTTALLSAFMVFILASCSSSGDSEAFSKGIESYNSGDYEAAIESFQKACDAGPSDDYTMSDIYSCLGNSYLASGNMDKALENYNSALQEDPENVRNYTNLAIAYRQNGDNESAKELYEEALKIDPEYPELNSSLGSLYLLEGDYEKSIEYFEKAIKLDPELSVAYGNAALAYAKTGDFENADKYLNLSIEKGYSNAETIRDMIDSERN